MEGGGGGWGEGVVGEEECSRFIIPGHEEKQKIPSIGTRRRVILHPIFSLSESFSASRSRSSCSVDVASGIGTWNQICH